MPLFGTETDHAGRAVRRMDVNALAGSAAPTMHGIPAKHSAHDGSIIFTLTIPHPTEKNVIPLPT